LWTKLKKNAEHRRKKITKKRFKGLDKPPHYSSPTVQYTYERDYTFQCDSRVSIGTLGGRISVLYQGYNKHMALIREGATIGDAKLWYDNRKSLTTRQKSSTLEAFRTFVLEIGALAHGTGYAHHETLP